MIIEWFARLRGPILIRCDVPRCAANIICKPGTMRAVRDEAFDKGWGYVFGMDMCPEHCRPRSWFVVDDHAPAGFEITATQEQAQK